MGEPLIPTVCAAHVDWKTRDYGSVIDSLPPAALSTLFERGLLSSEDILDEAPENLTITDNNGFVSEAASAYVEEVARARLGAALDTLRAHPPLQKPLEPGWVLLEPWCLLVRQDTLMHVHDALTLLSAAGVFQSVRYQRVVASNENAERRAAHARLMADYGDKDVGYLLTDLVRDAKSEEADGLNSDGVDTQLYYLVVDCGLSEDDVRATLASYIPED